MIRTLKTGLIFALLLHSGLEADETMTLADFETEATSLDWMSVNDGVMGGRSKGDSFVTEASHLLFKCRSRGSPWRRSVESVSLKRGLVNEPVASFCS